jgi:thiamine biosynthesis lipoprotein
MTRINTLKKTIPLILVAFLLGLVFYQIFKQAHQPFVSVSSGRIMMMGTFVEIQIQADTAEHGSQALKNAVDALHDYDRQISTYRDDSEMSKVNRLAADGPVQISDLTFDILKKSVKYNELSKAAFDITGTPLFKLWKQAGKAGRLPTPAEIAEAKKYVGSDKIVLTENPKTVRFTVKGVKLTVEALAEGYAVDYAMTALKKVPGVQAALIDLGGEVACFGRPWIVGIQDPFVPETDQFSEQARWRLSCQNICVSTSGNYRHFVTINGHRYSHIIDPRTGQPAEKLPSVTILAPHTADADALATAVSVLGVKDGLKLLKSLPGVEALLVAGTADKPEILRTPGFSRYEIPSN